MKIQNVSVTNLLKEIPGGGGGGVGRGGITIAQISPSQGR